MYNKDITKIKNKIEGVSGEILALNFLKKKKYKIITTNYRNKVGEIDIIAEKDGIIVFVEVKSRSTLAYGRPIEAVDFRKKNKIKKTAELYLMFNRKSECDVRFDVIEIVGDTITHIENAFM
ncbi:MAG: YraN family protein [Candidatus Caccovivens sp.]